MSEDRQMVAGTQVERSAGSTRPLGCRLLKAAQEDKRALTKGQSMVEFALVAPMVLLLIFGIADLSHLFFVQMTLQNAVRQAGRYAVTGRSQTGLSRLDSIRKIAQDAGMGLIPDPSTVQVSAVGTSGSAAPAGGAGDVVTISLTTDMQIITPIIRQFFTYGTTSGDYHFTVSASFKNEYFPGDGT